MAELGFPTSLRYSTDHEWVATTADDSVVRVGITDYAQDSLGEVVYVDLPTVGDVVEAGQSCGEVESTKSVSEIIAPVSGNVVQVNEDVDSGPETVNSDPYGDGWLFEISLSDPAQLDLLMNSEQYVTHVESEGA